MTKNICIYLLLLTLLAGCRGKSNKTINSKEPVAESVMQGSSNTREEAFGYNESKTLYGGAFTISSDYFAELSLNVETGEIIVIINGKETSCKLSLPENPEIYETGVDITIEDLNEDGYMDFILTPNYTARFPVSYVNLFCREKECFIATDDDMPDDAGETAHQSSIANTIGFITFYHEDIDGENKITLLNDDGTVWMAFEADQYHNGMQIEWKEDFSPWELESETMTFVIRCVGKYDGGYCVVVNESSGEEKRMRYHRNIKISTIEEHILDRLISFNPVDNPIKDSPGGTTMDLSDTPGDLFTIVGIEGDWIKIRDEESNNTLGWIRWRENDRLLISIYYSM
jgi:hypothetical protein